MTYDEALQCSKDNTTVLLSGVSYYVDHVEGDGDTWLWDGVSKRPIDNARVVDLHVNCGLLELP